MTHRHTFVDPATPVMEGIVDLHAYIMFYLVGIVVFVFVGMALVVSEFARATRADRVVAAGVVHAVALELVWTLTPLGVLVTVAFPSFALLYAAEEKSDPAVSLKAVGHQWYWEYQYAFTDGTDRYFGFDSYVRADADLTPGDLRLLEVDTTVVLPAYHRVRLLTTSVDVIHSWALPAAGTKTDAVPGRLNCAGLYFNRPGTYYGQCSELCGVNHGFMPIAVKTVDADKFRGWAGTAGA